MHRATGALLPIMAVVAIAFLIIGLALPVLPLHVHFGLGLSTVVVGVVTGSQFVASLVSRVWAGQFSDRHDARRATMVGLAAAVVSGLLYLGSLGFTGRPWVSVSLLVAGRAMLGIAESFVMTGAAAWGLSALGPQNAGRVIAWIGVAMFAAMALGAPVGMGLYSLGGFAAVGAATAAIPLVTLLTLLLTLPTRPASTSRGASASPLKIARAIWMPGLGSALSSVGYGAMLAFSSLLATERGWSPVWLTFTSFAFALIAARVLFGHVPDRIGGAKVALVSIALEAAGLALLWAAQGPVVAAVGGALTGFGYSLVYPGLGVEAVRRAPPQSRGLAMGAYTGFLDVAIGISSPILGIIAGWEGSRAVFLAAALVVACAGIIAVRLLASPAAPQDHA